MSQSLRVGVIGCGFISKVHFEGYKKCKDVETVGFCDIIPERAEKALHAYGGEHAHMYTDYREMIEKENLDAVSVCTENNKHAEITIYALNAGLHVLCEKPMAITGAEADAMVEAAKRSGKKLTVGYHLRFQNDAQLLRRRVEKGELGHVYYAEATTLRRRGVPTWGVFLNREKQGGGPLIDTGTHIVDSTLWLMNDYSPVQCAIGSTSDALIERGGFNNGGHWDIDSFEVEDSAFGTVILKSGAMVVVKATWAANIQDMNLNEVLLLGDNAGASLKNGQLTMNGEKDDRLWLYKPDPIDHDPLSPYDKELIAWVDAIRSDTPPCVLPEEAAQVVKMLEALYISARDGGKPYMPEGE